MDTKTCFKCGVEKELDAFYRHSKMWDGHLNKCKDCTREDVRLNRVKNIDRVRAYDRARGSRQTPEYHRERRDKNPRKYKATRMVNNAIRDGKLFAEPCEVCGTNESVHAHHDDYLKPLNVRWLCAVHHKQWHVENGEGANPR